jgi:hypothetical protein
LDSRAGEKVVESGKATTGAGSHPFTTDTKTKTVAAWNAMTKRR